MLLEILVTNLAIIQDIQVRFADGLNVLTGETGAGKSIIVGAIGLVMGDRASSEMIRSGSDSVEVQAVFSLEQSPKVVSFLREQDIEASNELIVRRVITKNGNNRVYLNGTLVPLAVLRQVGESMVNIYGQHESQGLLRSEIHMDILDAYGGLQLERAKVAQTHERCKDRLARLQSLENREADRAAREDYLKFKIREIEKANLRDGELEECNALRMRLQGAHQLAEVAEKIRDAGYESEGSLYERVVQLTRSAAKVESFDSEFGQVTRMLEQISITAQELGDFCRTYLDGLDHDPQALEQVEDRVHAVKQICRKYGPTEADALAAVQQAQEELGQIQTLSSSVERLRGDVEKARVDLVASATKLQDKRKKAAMRMSGEIERELSELDIQGARFFASMEPLAGVGIEINGRYYDASGSDRIEFMLSANPGEPLRPVSKVASGGELSRILLAIKNAVARHFWVPTLVFDEVDVGISGVQAESIGKKLTSIAKVHQVLVITHLPQIASMADHHYRVGKTVEQGRTRSFVEKLTPSLRVEETARLLSGEKITETTRAAAREMLSR